MKAFRQEILEQASKEQGGSVPPHCMPSSELEVYELFRITEKCLHFNE